MIGEWMNVDEIKWNEIKKYKYCDGNIIYEYCIFSSVVIVYIDAFILLVCIFFTANEFFIKFPDCWWILCWQGKKNGLNKINNTNRDVNCFKCVLLLFCYQNKYSSR